MKSTPSAVGQAEVEDHEVGLARSRVDQALLHRFRLEHLPALRLERRADEAPDLRVRPRPAARVTATFAVIAFRQFVALCVGHGVLRSRRLGRRAERQGEPESRPAARRRSRPRSFPVRLDDRAADRETEADARGGRFARSAGELLEDRLFLALRNARARRRSPLRRSFAGDFGGDARSTVPGGVYLAAFSSRLYSTRSISARRARPAAGRRELALRRDDGRAPLARDLSALPTTSSNGCHCAAQLDLAALDPRHVEQIVDERAHPPRLLGDGAARFELRSGQRGRVSASDSARPISAASGVRRSCDSAESSELRSRSDSMLTSACCATST